VGDVVLDGGNQFADMPNLPRRMRLVVMSRNHRSTKFNHEELVGVKCRWKRLCSSSHGAHILVLVRRIVVQDDVLALGDFTVDQLQEDEELLVSMP